MPMPQKKWFRINEVAKRWSIPPSDIEDYALDELLQLCVFVVDVPAEAGSFEYVKGREHALIEANPLLNGPQPLTRSSLLEIFQDGMSSVMAFHTGSPKTYLHLADAVPAIIVRKEQLIITREERDRFEREHGSANDNGTMGIPVPDDVWHNEAFTNVRVGGEWHSFGLKQSTVLRLLKTASDNGTPWCDGKRLLQEAGASTMRMVDLFKRKIVWRQIVVNDGKGRYRINPEFLVPDRNRVRIFRKFSHMKVRAS